VLLQTEEPYVPWELTLLDEPWFDDAPPFLAAQANVGRWILKSRATARPPRSVDASSMAVVSGSARVRVMMPVRWRIHSSLESIGPMRSSFGTDTSPRAAP
jgi:hypothetical protein